LAPWLSSPTLAAPEPPPETTILRLPWAPAICLAPVYAAEPALRAEGFTDIRFGPRATGLSVLDMVADGQLDLSMTTAPALVYKLDQRRGLTTLAGVHSGCYELFVHGDINTVRDLEGKRVAVRAWGAHSQLYVSALAAHIGLDPRHDIDWVLAEDEPVLEVFARGDADAFLGFTPEPQELRARGIGRVILNTAFDRPWSQYFCCLAYGNSDWIARHPVAAKRAIRAFLKTADLCASQPSAIARRLVDRGFFDHLGYATEGLEDIPYSRWREFDPEDALRFYALRLHEAGLVEHAPAQIIEGATDWRVFEQLKRELKA
jgi:NitT/TauT family transport system substrate-binding protein